MLGSEYHESSAETISTGKVKSSSSSTSGGEEGLLESQTILYPKESMCLIVDGMDQNTTMVPKLRQAVKGIEGRYVKSQNPFMRYFGTRQGSIL